MKDCLFAYMYGMEKTIFYFFEPAKLTGRCTHAGDNEDVFIRHSFRERNKVLQGITYEEGEYEKAFTGEIAGVTKGKIKGKMVGFAVPGLRRKGEAWESGTLSRVIEKTLKQYEDYAPKILLQSNLSQMLQKEKSDRTYEKEKETAFQIGEDILLELPDDRMSRLSILVPGDDYFLLEEELFWMKEVLKDKLVYTKEISFFVMRSKGIPPVVYEFTDYLTWEYGIVSDVWDMKHFCIEELLHKKGLCLGNVPKVILDMDGKTGLPKALCPAGSMYFDLFSSEQTKQAYNRENSDIYYISPCSLLDTIINNRYNIVVN